MSTGIICEYNPFHNGHLHHLLKAKELFPNDTIILVMSSHFLQRGETSLINKWDKTEIALSLGVDIVVELPFVFSSQSADVFANGAIQILKNLKVDRLVFGSEVNDIEVLEKLVDTQLNNIKYNEKVRFYLDSGVNYPTAMSMALRDIHGYLLSSPNDLLGVSYIKEIVRQESGIRPYTIKRTNDFHSQEADNVIASATSIRKLLKENKSIESYVPEIVPQYIDTDFFIDNYFPMLQYKIISEINNLQNYQTVDEGIENRIRKYIYTSNTLEELIANIKTKRYTYNKLKRMFVHILCSFTKEEAKQSKEIQYVRVLGFSKNGQNYLNKVKKACVFPIITGFSNIKSDILNIEYRVSCIYFSIKTKNKINLMKMEYNRKPIIK